MPKTVSQNYRYPALIGCIAEARQPDRQELKRVAIRIRAEAFPGSPKSFAAAFRVNRVVWRAARTALGVGVPYRAE